ncbi:Inner membrane protein YqaA [Vibrio aerogenes CECT 7868]|uniref:Inner membrane protein YqaA n=1 Tax=Vibrio aerogenes CECT 7868 TaxID=1216006 RepID=A0A1M5YF37_9VIBR|nr:YqaA family protein [Vibrio aerogenes]SHI10143.1 Inner membrane protein YqaA [Vibrio aerogenes CECT 7868]
MLDLLDSVVFGSFSSFSDMSLWVLFFSSFLSATLLPGSSEAALVATLSLQQFSPAMIVFIATLGNSLGGMTNYCLGVWVPNRTHINKHGHKSLVWLKKYGYWTLLLSWMPVIGDALCIAAGWLRMKFFESLICIVIGKTVRYIMLTVLFYGFF